MKTVLVTGGAKGIGRCLVENLAKEGYRVFASYCHSEKEAIQMKEDLREKGYQIEIGKADIANREEAEELVRKCISTFGNIDVLINNAGISQVKPFLDTTEEDWDTMIATNLSSVFYITKKVLENMLQQKSGCIINISSIWGLIGSSCEVAYSAAKAGMLGMTKALAKEFGPSHIRVNAIAPGYIQTEMTANLSEEEKKDLLAEIPLGRGGEPCDIYPCVKWLIEENYTTGQVISPNRRMGYCIKDDSSK